MTLSIGRILAEESRGDGTDDARFATLGIPDDAIAQYYRQRAQAEVGLVLSDGTVIDRPASRNDPKIPFFHGDAALAGWRHVIEEVHAAGGRMGPQLWHVGSMPNFFNGWAPDVPVESPSGRFAADQPRGETMSDAAIADTIAAFGRAAADAKRLGFDTFEIHGAHGYLIDQFFGRMERDEFDLIAVGRALLSDPLWVRKIREGDQAGLQPFQAEALQTLR
ncbi:MAG: hypothetical protein ACRYGL_05465 [Janthinobacterium lividum]